MKTTLFISCQHEVKRRTLIHFTFCPYLAPVFVNDSLNDGKAHPSAFKLFLGVKPLKDPKQLVIVLHVKAGAIICDVIDGVVSALLEADLYSGIWLMKGIFPG